MDRPYRRNRSRDRQRPRISPWRRRTHGRGATRTTRAKGLGRGRERRRGRGRPRLRTRRRSLTPQRPQAMRRRRWSRRIQRAGFPGLCRGPISQLRAPSTDAAPNVWAARGRGAIAVSSAIAVETKRSSLSIENGISPPSPSPQPSSMLSSSSSSSSSSSMLPTSSTWGKGQGGGSTYPPVAGGKDGKVVGATHEFQPLSMASRMAADRLTSQTTSMATPSSCSWPTATVTCHTYEGRR